MIFHHEPRSIWSKKLMNETCKAFFFPFLLKSSNFFSITSIRKLWNSSTTFNIWKFLLCEWLDWRILGIISENFKNIYIYWQDRWCHRKHMGEKSLHNTVEVVLNQCLHNLQMLSWQINKVMNKNSISSIIGISMISFSAPSANFRKHFLRLR